MGMQDHSKYDWVSTDTKPNANGWSVKKKSKSSKSWGYTANNRTNQAQTPKKSEPAWRRRGLWARKCIETIWCSGEYILLLNRKILGWRRWFISPPVTSKSLHISAVTAALHTGLCAPWPHDTLLCACVTDIVSLPPVGFLLLAGWGTRSSLVEEHHLNWT